MTRLQSLFDLTGRRAFVTGGNSGIGEAMARALGLAGAAVTLVARRETELLAAVARLQSEDIAADAITCDLSAIDSLRACGLSRQKQGYARSLAELVKSGDLDIHNLPEDDEAAIALLTSVKGIGRWSAEIYLLFAEGREDIWPAGDLAVQIDVGRVMGLTERPSEKLVREIGEAWRPHRGAAAVFSWHHYATPGI